MPTTWIQITIPMIWLTMHWSNKNNAGKIKHITTLFQRMSNICVFRLHYNDQQSSCNSHYELQCYQESWLTLSLKVAMSIFSGLSVWVLCGWLASPVTNSIGMTIGAIISRIGIETSLLPLPATSKPELNRPYQATVVFGPRSARPRPRNKGTPYWY